ncbi:MAG: ADP-ribosylglycohydrolase family protein, partial [Myxococcota bacterium]
MMMVLGRSVVDSDGVESLAILRALAHNHEVARGYGKGTRAVFKAYLGGATLSEATRSLWPEGSRGNGAAVRTPPIACRFAWNETKLDYYARASALATHSHPDAIDAALITARLVAACIRNGRLEPKALFVGSIRDLKGSNLLTGMMKVQRLIETENVTTREVLSELGASTVAAESVPLAVYAALRFLDRPTDALRFALTAGGDTDTISAIVGAIVGAANGQRAWPSGLLSRLEGRDVLREQAKTLVKRGMPTAFA